LTQAAKNTNREHKRGLKAQTALSAQNTNKNDVVTATAHRFAKKHISSGIRMVNDKSMAVDTGG
jgi:hypothetical protein